jgi:hypothetical protein
MAWRTIVGVWPSATTVTAAAALVTAVYTCGLVREQREQVGALRSQIRVQRFATNVQTLQNLEGEFDNHRMRQARREAAAGLLHHKGETEALADPMRPSRTPSHETQAARGLERARVDRPRCPAGARGVRAEVEAACGAPKPV